MNFEFYLPQLEIRSKDTNGLPTYVIRGYASVPNYPYLYKTENGKSFKEYFTPKCLENLKHKIKNQKVFADYEHKISTKNSTELILDKIKSKVGSTVDEEIDFIKKRIKYSEIPMFKPEDIIIDEKGVLVEIRGNPFYREIDEEHKKEFDAVWGSAEQGFINGLSFNFKPISTVKINENLTQIDDIDLYGISLTGSPANDKSNIIEVAMRSIEHLKTERSDVKCQKMTTSLLM